MRVAVKLTLTMIFPGGVLFHCFLYFPDLSPGFLLSEAKTKSSLHSKPNLICLVAVDHSIILVFIPCPDGFLPIPSNTFFSRIQIMPELQFAAMLDTWNAGNKS